MPEGRVPEDQFQIYSQVIASARARRIPFAVGGAFGYGAYTGVWRNTKDLDLYILPQDREAMLAVFTQAGLEDYYPRLAYDRRWIHRGFANGIIVDIMWAMANQRAEVDSHWLNGGREFELNGLRLRALPAEELLWAKLYVLQRERCDWQDVLNIVGAAGRTLDWDRLLARLGDDLPVLRAVLSLFAWIAPGLACELPGTLWLRVGLPCPEPSAESIDRYRAGLLDLRPWFMTGGPS